MTMNNKNTFYFRQISEHSRVPYTFKKIIIHPQINMNTSFLNKMQLNYMKTKVYLFK